MKQNSYEDFHGFEQVYLEDSYVIEIRISSEGIMFNIELVLREKHPLYVKPKRGEHHCYVKGRLVFPEVQRYSYFSEKVRFNVDASGAKDLGNIDALRRENDVYKISGDWGAIEVKSGEPRLEYE